MRLLSPGPILVLVLAGAAATVALVIGACTDPDTQTPTCDNNVNANGIYARTPTGATGSPSAAPTGAPSTCCVDADGGALTGNDLATCLHGYGDQTCAYLVSTTATGA